MHMSLTMATCVDMFYVEDNGILQNICGANADAIRAATKINYVPIMPDQILIEELRTDSEPILEVIIFLDHLMIDLLI